MAEVIINQADYQAVIADQSQVIGNLNVSIKAYARTVAKLEAEIDALKPAEEEGEKED